MYSGEETNRSIEVSLISERAGACDMFFHLFFVSLFRKENNLQTQPRMGNLAFPRRKMAARTTKSLHTVCRRQSYETAVDVLVENNQ